MFEPAFKGEPVFLLSSLYHNPRIKMADIPKPSFALNEMIDLINMSTCKTDIEIIDYVIQKEKKRYCLTGLKYLAKILKAKKEKIYGSNPR